MALVKLLDQWLPPDRSGPPVACLATTFTFQPGFFEEECLARFLGLDSALVSGRSDQDSLVYVLEREERLSEVKASVLVERGRALAPGTHRWDVIPVTAPFGGVQHAKVSLLLWRDAMRLLVASANLTEAGYRSNVEIFFSFDLPAQAETADLVRDGVDFLRAVVERATQGSDAADSPRGRARSTLALADGRLAALPKSGRGRGAPAAALVHSMAGPSLLEQAFSQTWRGSPPREYVALSPYFDRGERLAGVESLENHLAKRGRVEAEIAVVADRAGEDQVRIRAPKAIAANRGRLTPDLGSWIPLDDHEDRVLHAKAYLFQNSERVMLFAGSPNLTEAALGAPARNIEAAVAVADASGRVVGEELIGCIPAFEELPDGRRFYEAPVSEDEEPGVRLPAGFVEALYEPQRRRVVVSLRPAKLPEEWTMRGPEGIWFRESDAAPRLCRELGETPAPNRLSVEWAEAGEARTAELIVSVAEAAALPDAAEIADITLDELLDLLAAGGRLRALLEKLVARRSAALVMGGVQDSELDPHAKVDTSEFILQRARRAGLALEGLRQRLSQPVSHPDALARRLRGPFGPLGLARALERAREAGQLEPREHAFMLAELALSVSRAEWAPAGELRLSDCRTAAQAVVREIRPRRKTGDGALDSYVRRAFRKAAE